jgi:hypothetical protein
MIVDAKLRSLLLLSVAWGCERADGVGEKVPVPKDMPIAVAPVGKDSGDAAPPKSGVEGLTEVGSAGPTKSGSEGPTKSGSGGPTKSGSERPTESGSEGPTKSGAEMPGFMGKPGKPAAARRYIALVNKAADAACPPSVGVVWGVEPLFRSGMTAQLVGKGRLPRALERFCQYTWAGKSPPAAAPSFDPAAGVVRVDADLDVVMPQTAAPGYLGGDPGVLTGLAASFRAAGGLVASGVADAGVHGAVTGPAYVAVIDSVGFADGASTHAGSDPRLHHGLAMGEFIADARCPNGESGCREKRFFAQAFPYSATSPQALPGGGPLGSIGSLAHAIGEALVRWQQSEKLKGSPLVLNMSVAWDPRFGADLTPPGSEAEHWKRLITPSEQVPATVQAVHAALVYAACLDALSFAAAGNNAGAPCEEQGAMAPARWERYPAPNAAACQQIFEQVMPRRAGEAGYPAGVSSLVYAAGGVVASGEPIPIARPGSTPARVLMAFAGVAGAGVQQTDVWTGTSVATALLSGIAGQVWSHQRTLTPAQVVAVIDSSGTMGPAQEMLAGIKRSHFITGHGAFERLCVLRGGACANPYQPPQMNPLAATLATGLPVAAAQVNLAAGVPLGCNVRSMQCGTGTSDVIECGDTAPSAMAAPTTPEPWLRPQPGIPMCPVCPVRGGKLTLSLNPDFGTAPQFLQDPTLAFRRSDGSYLAARLGAITVAASGTEVDLANYTVVVGGVTQTLAAALVGQADAGTLTFSVVDAAGRRSRLVSAVPVIP